MFDILKGPDRFSRSLPALPHKRQAVETLRFDLNKVISYRRGLGRKVDSNHLLVRLLGSLNVSLTLKDEPYVWGVMDNALALASSLRLTSAWGPGKVHTPGVFYGPGVEEVIVACIDPFDVTSARNQWEQLSPIRVMCHPYNDFTLPYLDGTGEGLTGGGRAVLVINVAMLAFQHRCWWEHMVRGNPDSPPSVNQFLAAYPLANLLNSHLDITLANRLMAQALDRPIVEQVDPNPFYVGYRHANIDSMLREALEYMRKRTLSFDDWISAIPQASVEDLHTWLALPDLAFTTQVEWAFFMARLPILGFLLAFNAQQDSTFNLQYVNQITHWVRRMRNGRLYNQGLRGDMAEQVLDDITQTIDPYL
jgi:hypothetical protein